MTFKQLKEMIDLKIVHDMYYAVLKEKWEKAIELYLEKSKKWRKSNGH